MSDRPVDPPHIERHDAVQIVRPRVASPALVLSCEHASERLPVPWRWPDEDGWLRGTHWALDIGAAALTHQIADATGAGAVLAEVSRLFIDLNRPVDSSTLFRAVAEGRTVYLNAAIDEQERVRRLAYYDVYHSEFDRLVRQSPDDAVVLSVHSFTDEYEGRPRTLEVGVLFDRDEALGRRLTAHLAAVGIAVAENEPYSGKKGMIFAPHHHATRHGRRTVELEVRQDRAVQAPFRRRLVAALASFDFA